jgi:hypothetical protein
MKLVRIVTLTFDRRIDVPSTMTCELGGVKVGCMPTTVRGQPSDSRLAIAETDLASGISIDGAGYVVVPDEPRRACENAIESLANILAVFNRCGRQISSATPSVALCDLKDGERALLDASKGFRGPKGSSAAVHWSLDVTDPELVKAMADRLPGVGLLAEVSTTKHSVAKYRELIRFLEHAFARSLNKLEKKLSQFLISGDLGYTRNEVQDWIAPRGMAPFMAIDKSAKTSSWRGTVRRFLPRLEQAAYDVLFNKAVWHDPSRTRRSTLFHCAATTNPNATDIRMTRGRDFSMQTQVLDAFEAYPLNMHGILTSPPSDWWYQPPKPSTPEASVPTSAGSFTVLDGQ